MSTSSTAVLVPGELAGKVRAIFEKLNTGKKSTSPEIEQSIADVLALFVDGNTEGGVYLIQITGVSGKPVIFHKNGKTTQDYVLVKIGRADNYKNRFSQFKFQYKRVLTINGANTMEKDLKTLIPANFKSYFFGVGTKKEKVDRAFGIMGGNNGATEWRVMTKKTFDAIVAQADKINSLNWREKLALAQDHKLDEKTLSIALQDTVICTNTVILSVQ
jgi:hypothetical protein